jgi:CBS domain-containing protein
MPTTDDVLGANPEMLLEFLKKTVPFDELDSQTLQDLVPHFAVKTFAKETVLFRQDEDDVDHFYLIHEGGVKTYLSGPDGADTLLDFRRSGGYFGALAIIRGSKANFNVETLEDTVCLELDKQRFIHLIRNYPRFSQYYLKSLSDDLVGTCYAELRSRKIGERPQEMLYLLNVEVGDVIKRPPEMIHASETIRQAATRMADLEIGSLLVQDQSGGLVGILTDKDLRKKVVAQGYDYNQPVAGVMSSPLRTIESHALCFDALLHMMNERVHHLAVERGKQIVGVVSVHDIMVQEGSSPLYLFREIAKQRTIEDLYPFSRRIPRVVRALVQEGVRANNITRIITVLNDQIVQGLLTMLRDRLGPPPFPFCWITFGSEGRKEQTFKTDQDNAIIYATPPEDWDEMKLARAYFRRFSAEATHHLDACGYPLCKGKMMASNPRWRKPYQVWRTYFDRWLDTPEPQEVLNATIFFDFRSAFGQTEFADDLRDYLALQIPAKGFFLLHLAKDCMAAKTPLTFFKNFILEREGRHKNQLDLKTHGLTTFVNFARLMALRNGVKETNTLARLDVLEQNGWIPRELYLETRDAYEFQMQLRLVNQLRLIEEGNPPSNYVDPSDLSELDRQTLKEAFSIIGRIQAYVKSEFRVLE